MNVLHTKYNSGYTVANRADRSNCEWGSRLYEVHLLEPVKTLTIEKDIWLVAFPKEYIL